MWKLHRYQSKALNELTQVELTTEPLSTGHADTSLFPNQGSDFVQGLAQNRRLSLVSYNLELGINLLVWRNLDFVDKYKYGWGQTDGKSAPAHNVDDMAFDEDLKVVCSNVGKFPVFLHNSTKPLPSDTTSPSLKISTRGTSGEQAGPSCRESARCNQADQPRHCGVCAKSTNIYNTPGWDSFLCSVCR